MANQVNVNKVRFIASYLADNVEELYVTKLMKLFYYVDFLAYLERGASVTGDTYYKLPYGPVPTFIKSEVNNIINEDPEDPTNSLLKGYIKAKAVKTKNYKGYIIESTGKKPSPKNISEAEFELLNKIVDKYKNTSARALSDQTHKEAPYKLSSENGVIDYSLALKLDVNSILG